MVGNPAAAVDVGAAWLAFGCAAAAAAAGAGAGAAAAAGVVAAAAAGTIGVVVAAAGSGDLKGARLQSIQSVGGTRH